MSEVYSTQDEGDLFHRLERAFNEFLTTPTAVITGLILLAVLMSGLDRARPAWLEPLRDFVSTYLFTNAQATGDFFSTLASGIMTVVSITISMLLLALQQATATLGTRVFDQFVERRWNQAFFGFFVGSAFYMLLILATVSDTFNPVYSATVALLLAGLVLYGLVVVLYTTIRQMRPEVILKAIHDKTLRARRRQLPLVRRTRRESQYDGPVCRELRSEQNGFITRIRLEKLEQAIAQTKGEVEIDLQVSYGTYVAYRGKLAYIRAEFEEDADALAAAIPPALDQEIQRSLDYDAIYGIEQIEMGAWTAISTSKSNPEPGMLATRILRDITARLIAAEEQVAAAPPLPIVYRDHMFQAIMDTLESFAVVSSESMQHQNFVAVTRTLDILFDRMPPELQQRAENVILRMLSVMGDHMPSREMEHVLQDLVLTLEDAGRDRIAANVRQAWEELAQSIGDLNSRSTRVQ
jgi:uncharacterized membrane protein